MSETKYEVETTRKVFDNDLGTHIKVGPDTDGLGLLTVDGGGDYGGPIKVDPRMVRALCDAMMRCADEILANNR